MSISCEGFIGFTVNVAEGFIPREKFWEYNDFLDEHKEYDRRDCKEKVRFVTDGMNGLYVRLIFVKEFLGECWNEGKDYFSLEQPMVPENVYQELNKAYKKLCGKELNEADIDYALWFHFT